MENLLFLLISGAIALVVVATLVRAASRGQEVAPASAEFDIAVYRDQLAELDSELAQGRVSAEEGARLRTEISRRLLEADRIARAQSGLSRPVSSRSLMVASGLAVVAVLMAIGIYSRVGAPGYPDLPLAERIALTEERHANRPSQETAEKGAPAPEISPQVEPSFLELMDKLRAAMKERPDDAQGLRLLARNEAALGNIIPARKAQEQLLSVLGDKATAQDHEALAEMMIVAAGGYVSPEAEEQLKKTLSIDPKNPIARYYSGEMFAQIGRYDRTFVLWRALVDEGPADAPWLTPIRAQIEDVAARAGINYTLPPQDSLKGPSQDDINAAAQMNVGDRQAMIEGMVAQLGERLASEGGSVEEWARLISSLGVLGRKDEAKEIYAEAQSKFVGKDADLSTLKEAAQRAGIEE